jgi:hypothetical protein
VILFRQKIGEIAFFLRVRTSATRDISIYAAFESAGKRTPLSSSVTPSRCDGTGQRPPTSPFVHPKPVTGRANPRRRPAPIRQGEGKR